MRGIENGPFDLRFNRTRVHCVKHKSAQHELFLAN
jgi:hypothetical protein